MSIPVGSIRNVHHVGLPSRRQDWSRIIDFWESLELTCRIHVVSDEDYDHAGAGDRLQVFAGSQLVVSYYCLMEWLNGPPSPVLSNQHLALTLEPPALQAARTHVAFERETHWGHSNTSVFLAGPYGLHVELVTTNPNFHRDHA